MKNYYLLVVWLIGSVSAWCTVSADDNSIFANVSTFAKATTDKQEKAPMVWKQKSYIGLRTPSRILCATMQLKIKDNLPLPADQIEVIGFKYDAAIPHKLYKKGSCLLSEFPQDGIKFDRPGWHDSIFYQIRFIAKKTKSSHVMRNFLSVDDIIDDIIVTPAQSCLRVKTSYEPLGLSTAVTTGEGVAIGVGVATLATGLVDLYKKSVREEADEKAKAEKVLRQQQEAALSIEGPSKEKIKAGLALTEKQKDLKRRVAVLDEQTKDLALTTQLGNVRADVLRLVGEINTPVIQKETVEDKQNRQQALENRITPLEKKVKESPKQEEKPREEAKTHAERLYQSSIEGKLLVPAEKLLIQQAIARGGDDLAHRSQEVQQILAGLNQRSNDRKRKLLKEAYGWDEKQIAQAIRTPISGVSDLFKRYSEAREQGWLEDSDEYYQHVFQKEPRPKQTQQQVVHPQPVQQQQVQVPQQVVSPQPTQVKQQLPLQQQQTQPKARRPVDPNKPVIRRLIALKYKGSLLTPEDITSHIQRDQDEARYLIALFNDIERNGHGVSSDILDQYVIDIDGVSSNEQRVKEEKEKTIKKDYARIIGFRNQALKKKPKTVPVGDRKLVDGITKDLEEALLGINEKHSESESIKEKESSVALKKAEDAFDAYRKDPANFKLLGNFGINTFNTAEAVFEDKGGFVKGK